MDPISISLTVVGWVAPQLVTEFMSFFCCRRKQRETADRNLIFLKRFVELGRVTLVSHWQGDFLYSKDWLRSLKDAISDAEDAIYSYQFGNDQNQIHEILEIFEKLAVEDSEKLAVEDSRKILASRKFFSKSLLLEIPNWRRTTYLVSRQIKGRTIEKDKLKKWLLNDQSSTCSDKNFSILSIIGTGGIGKTMLSQVAFDDQEVRRKFEVMAWVWLCNPHYPIIHIKANESPSVSFVLNPVSFEDFHNKFLSEMGNKKFFMVLDDVWDEMLIEWDTYCSLFNRGKDGSKIIVTTQLEGVANMIDSDFINLDVLQHEEYLKLFEECAFSNNHSLLEESASGNKRPCHDRSILDAVYHSVSKRFGCSPLVAVEVGHELRRSFDQERWNSILLNKFCIADRRDGDIISILGFCYEQLPRRLKQCYLSCALFPRNYQFEKHQLNLIWIGMSFIHSGSTTGNYVDDFSKRSFFIDTTRTNNKYVFHPVLHELAECISDGEFFRREKQIMQSESIRIPKEARHVYISADNFTKASEALRRNEKLRSLIIDGDLSCPYHEKSFMISLERVLSDLKSLRFLVLSVLPRSLPKTVGKLKYLRYLQFPSNQQTLPKLSDSFWSNYKLKRWDSKYLLVAKDIDESIKLHCRSANIVDATI